MADAAAGKPGGLRARDGRDAPRARVRREVVRGPQLLHQVSPRYSQHSLAFHAHTSSRWRGTGEKEEGYDEKTGKVLVKVDPQYFRPAEVE